MCYREPPALDLKSIQIACLCGPNGHGKSALLDAITWALWGETRARTQDELIHQGQTDMSVELDFSARDRIYRVCRRHSRKRGRQGATMLELQVESNGQLIPITGNTVRATEAAIRGLIHMDYETFVNTAFLLQGRADMFTAATPSKRKQLLAEVLDLGYYESLAARARHESRDRDRRIATLDATVEAHSAEIQNKTRYTAELADRQALMNRSDSDLREARAKADDLRVRTEQLRARAADLAAMEARLRLARSELASLEERAAAHNLRIADLVKLTERRTEIEAGFADLKEARQTIDSLGRTLATLNDLQRQRASVDTKLAVRRERVNSALDAERSRLADLTLASQSIAQLQAAQVSMAEDRKAVTYQEQQAEELRSTLSSLRAESTVLDSQAGELRSQMENTRSRFDLLGSKDATCPVCRQPLDDDGADHLRGEYQREGKKAKRLHSENRSRAEQLSLQIKCAEESLAMAAPRAAKARRDLDRRSAQLERDLEAAQSAASQIEACRARIDELEASLIQEARGDRLRRELAEIDSRIQGLGYDPAIHKDTRERLSELEPYSRLHLELERSDTHLPVEREARDHTNSLAEGRRREIKDGERATAELRSQIDALPVVENQLSTTAALVRDLESRIEALAEQIGGLREAIARCEHLEAKVIDCRQRRHVLAADVSIYDELSRAFGKNGIQAMVIETAIPQITSSASHLLRRLTDGGMTVKLELNEGRREGRSGEPTEQLDIRVGDEHGNTRSYEMFSGGEAFRINFALRIALSKLLAARSGAPLPILFIDEGFGSQDADGQDRLREVINSIQDEFQKVLVITHIEAIKDSFPVRIEVEKTSSGSTFTVT